MANWPVRLGDNAPHHAWRVLNLKCRAQERDHDQGSYNGRILGKKSENQTFALFWSEFGGIFKSLEKFGGI